MSLPAFSGTNQIFLWNNDTLPSSRGFGTPNSTTGFGNTVGSSVKYDLFNLPITFQSAPSSLNNLTVNQITTLLNANNTPYSLSIQTVFTISGNQAYDCSDYPNMNLTIYENSNTIPYVTTNLQTLFPIIQTPVQPTGTISPFCYPGNISSCLSTATTCSCPQYSFQVPLNNSFFTIQVVPWSLGICNNYGTTNFSMSALMTITLSVSCQTGPALSSDFCFNYCSQLANQPFCEPNYRQFCTLDKNPTTNEINIFTNKQCQNFFEDYLSNNGPDSQVSSNLDVACASKFKGFDDFNKSSTDIQKICACHLDEQLYNNLQKSIIDKFAGFAFVAEDKRCLFLPCASSTFTTPDIGKRCALPGCINIADITNEGTITGNAKIIQGDQCANIESRTGPVGATGAAGSNGSNGGNGQPKSFWEKHWLWVVLGVGLLIVLIIVILIIIAAESGNKKKK